MSQPAEELHAVRAAGGSDYTLALLERYIVEESVAGYRRSARDALARSQQADIKAQQEYEATMRAALRYPTLADAKTVAAAHASEARRHHGHPRMTPSGRHASYRPMAIQIGSVREWPLLRAGLAGVGITATRRASAQPSAAGTGMTPRYGLWKSRASASAAEYGPYVTRPQSPDPRRLGVPKVVVDEGARTLRNARASFSTFLEGLADAAPPGSGAAIDEEWVASAHHKQRSPRRMLRARAAWTTNLTLTNIIDHVRAMERVLVGEPVAIWPCVSLSRVVQEGAIRICHLYDPAKRGLLHDRVASALACP